MSTMNDVTPAELLRLRAIESEYRITLRVLAVMAERLLAETGAERVEIGDDALLDTPDLVAWRNEPRKQMVITVAR